jgi:hypothetical protein
MEGEIIMKKQTSIYVTPADLWVGARREDANAVVQELRKTGLSSYSTPVRQAGQLGLIELLEATDRIRAFLPALLDECIMAAEEAREAERAAALRQAHVNLTRRREERDAARAAVTEAAARLAELLEEGIPAGWGSGEGSYSSPEARP